MSHNNLQELRFLPLFVICVFPDALTFFTEGSSTMFHAPARSPITIYRLPITTHHSPLTKQTPKNPATANTKYSRKNSIQMKR